MTEGTLRTEPGMGRRPVERAFDRASGGPAIPGNRVTVLQDGPEVYPAMLRLIAEAQHWIHFENYIIRADRIGQTFADALVARVARGRCRFACSTTGSARSQRHADTGRNCATRESRFVASTRPA